jgi:hypothetical protein
MDIAQAIRAQMLGQLIDAIGPAGGKPTAAPALPASVSVGQTLTATVLGELPGGRLALLVGGKPIVADTRGNALPPEARQPRTTLRLNVEAAGPTPRLTIAGMETPPPGLAKPPAPDVQAIAPVVRLAAAPDAAPARATSPSPPTPLQAALREAVSSAAAKQGGAAPLYANLATVAAQPDIRLPEPVKQIAALLLGARLDAEQPVTPDGVKQAIAAAAGTGEDGPDIKVLLATLKTLLPKPADGVQPLRPETQPEPPRRDSAPAAQKPALSTLTIETESRNASATLHRDAEQALERSKLQSYAGLPEARATISGEPARQQQLQVEIPLAFGPQTAMMGLKVERDRRRRREDGTPVDAWGIRFAIETDEIGAVHAHLKLAGQTLNVSLWADDAATHRAFVDAVPLLEAALREAAIEVGELAIFSGKPQEAAKPASGHFLDVSS